LAKGLSSLKIIDSFSENFDVAINDPENYVVIHSRQRV
jgi:hypothetical protein